MTKKVFYANDNLTKGVEVIARQIALDGFVPDLIVGVMRGGMVPAVYLSHWFDCPLSSIEWSTRDNAVGKNIDNRIIEQIHNRKGVLVVDDICDSGLTFRQIFDYIEDKIMFDHLRSAVLHLNIGQNTFKPDYCHLKINKTKDPQWIVYPWEDV